MVSGKEAAVIHVDQKRGVFNNFSDWVLASFQTCHRVDLSECSLNSVSFAYSQVRVSGLASNKLAFHFLRYASLSC